MWAYKIGTNGKQLSTLQGGTMNIWLALWTFNTPAVFQAFVDDVLREMLEHFVYVYLDDILIFSESYLEHVSHVKRVVQKLL